MKALFQSIFKGIPSVKTTLFHLSFLFVTIWGYNFNTLDGNWAIDDVIVFSNNRYVLKGFYGIKEVLTRPTFEGHHAFKDERVTKFGDNDDLPGGRWRPLSLVFFLIEREIYGLDPWWGHFLNIIYFMLAITATYFFLREIVFKNFNHNIAFFATLLFVIMPIHAEVVANIKSRDEILALLLNMLVLLLVVSNIRNYKWWKEPLYLVLYFLALLDKENALMFWAIIPITVWFFTDHPLKKYFRLMIPLSIVVIFYLYCRYLVCGINLEESRALFNDPYLYASFWEKYATQFRVLLYQLLLLIYPPAYSWDYNYKIWPYVTFFDPKAFLSLCIFTAMLIAGIWGLIKRKAFPAYAFLWYLIHIFIVSNLLINIGSYMGERFLFIPSLGFTILIMWLIDSGLNRLNERSKTRSIVILLLLMIPWFYLSFKKVYQRNDDWKDVSKLMFRDSESFPDNMKLQLGMANTYINMATRELVKSAGQDTILFKKYLQKALAYTIHVDTLEPLFLEGASAKFAVLTALNNNLDTMMYFMKLNPSMFSTEQAKSVAAFFAVKADLSGNDSAAKENYKIAYVLDPENTSNLLQLAKICYNLNQFDTAMALANQAFETDPKLIEADRLRMAAYQKVDSMYSELYRKNPALVDSMFKESGVENKYRKRNNK